jgi:hypothetical protein
MVTIAVSQRSRVVRFGAAIEIPDFFHLFKEGKRCRRLVDGFRRVFRATMFFDKPVVTDFPITGTRSKPA